MVSVEFVGLDELNLPLLDAEQAKAVIARRSEKLRIDGTLKVHFHAHQQAGARQKYAVHLFFEHGGHKHILDKQHGWELGVVLREAFDALETQLAREHR